MDTLEEGVKMVKAMTGRMPDNDLIKECLGKAVEEDNARGDGARTALNAIMNYVTDYVHGTAITNVGGWRLWYSLEPNPAVVLAAEIARQNGKRQLEAYTYADSIDSPELKPLVGKSLDILVLMK